MIKKICTNCVLDTSFHNIKFDAKGICNYCSTYKNNIHGKLSKSKKQNILDKITNKIKKSKYKKEYDCIIGVSGGLDSSYLVYYTVEILKLKPLLFHVDAGWNSYISSSNIEKLADHYNLELITHVIDWNEMRDLHLAYFESGVPSLDTIQDHAFFGALYNFVEKNKIKYIFTGGNLSTEFIRPPLDWAYHASDLTQIKDIHKKFGKIRIKNFPYYDIFRSRIYLRIFKGVKMYYPLNYIEYKKDDAVRVLKEKINYVEYVSKHHESRFTAFFENYWTRERFGHDRRIMHLSSLILSGQISRAQALVILNQDPLKKYNLDKELDYICDKLEITRDDLHKYLNQEKKSFRDYKSKFVYINFFTKILTFLKIEKRVF
jgi:N-acetyl sugar amidotransferase